MDRAPILRVDLMGLNQKRNVEDVLSTISLPNWLLQKSPIFLGYQLAKSEPMNSYARVYQAQILKGVDLISKTDL